MAKSKVEEQKAKIKVIRLPEVCNRVGLSKPSIYRLMAKGIFPASRKISERAVGWLESDVNEFITSR